MAKPKSTSKVKLTNKSANKRSKPIHKQLQKNTNKQLPPQQQQQPKQQQQNGKKVVINKTNEKKRKNTVNHVGNPNSHSSDSDVDVTDMMDDEDIAFSDDEMLSYANENVNNLSFFSHDLRYEFTICSVWVYWLILVKFKSKLL